MIAAVPVLVAAVGSVHDADPVLAAALRLARGTGAELHLVHALPTAAGAPEAEAALRERVRALAPGARVAVRAAPGPPARVLADAAERGGATLLLVGAPRRAGFGLRRPATTPARLLRAAHVPVLVLRTALAHPVRRVLLASDLSGAGADAHERGLDAVEALSAGTRPALRTLHVTWGGRDLVPEGGVVSDDDVARGELAAFLAERRPRAVEVEPVLRRGDAAREIAAEAAAWGADLVVVGTHGRSGAARLLLGSVAESVLRLAPCSVLVVPPAPVPAARPRLPADVRASDGGAENPDP